MPADVQTYRTAKFANYAPLIGLGALGWLLLAAIASALFSRTLVQQTLQVSPEATVQLEPVAVPQKTVGALRVDTRSVLDTNTWVTYEIQILDRQGNLLATGIKQAWRESGTWQEDGETGTWSESDIGGRLDVQASSIDPQEIVVAVTVFEHGRISGEALATPVPVRVTVRSGVIDSRHLVAGAVGVGLLSAISLIGLKQSGKKVIYEVVQDSDIGGRSVCGGANRLVHLHLRILSDETTPRRGHGSLEVDLYIKNSQGELIYEQRLPARLSYRTDDGKLDSARGDLRLNLILEPRDSYGFYLEVVPDGPVDATYLSVYDGRRTLTATEVHHLQGPS